MERFWEGRLQQGHSLLLSQGGNDALVTKGMHAGQQDWIGIRRLTNGTCQGLANIGNFTLQDLKQCAFGNNGRRVVVVILL